MSTCTFLAIMQTALAVSATAVPGQPPTNRNTPTPKALQTITVRKFRRLYWSPITRHMTSQGSVEIDAQPTPPGQETILTGENVDYDTVMHSVKVYGVGRVQREQDTLTGRNICYDFDAGGGDLDDASAGTKLFWLRGERIQALVDGTYVLINGVFTSCEHGRPDYMFHARHLSISPGHYLSGRYVTFYAGKTPITTVPYLHENLEQNSVVPTPLPSYSDTEGLVVRLYSTPIARPHETLDYALRVNFRTLPTGFVAYQHDVTSMSTTALPPRSFLQTINNPLRGFLEQIAPPTFLDYAMNRFDERLGPRTTFYAVATNEEGVFNRRTHDIAVTSAPEVGLQLQNILAHKRQASTDGSTAEASPTNSTESTLKRVPDAPLLVNFITSAGFYHEFPTAVDSARLATRLNVATQPYTLGRRISCEQDSQIRPTSIRAARFTICSCRRPRSTTCPLKRPFSGSPIDT